MKKNKVFYLIVLVVLITSSCRSTKDIELFQDLKTETSKLHVLNEPPQHKIKPFDNLYLSILTLDPEVNKLFNPSLAGEGFSSSTEQMFGSPTSQYINGYRVTTEGIITLPILGNLKLSGLTLKEAENLLKKRAEEYLQEPTVQVKLLNFRVNVLGEVNNPGFFYNYEGNINIIEAISQANGITKFADLNNVIINRQNESGIKTYRVNITNNSIYNSEVYYLQPNDLVYVPPTRLKTRNENERSYSLILSTISTLLVVFTLLK